MVCTATRHRTRPKEKRFSFKMRQEVVMSTTCYDPYHQSKVIHFHDYILLIVVQLLLAWFIFG